MYSTIYCVRRNECSIWNTTEIETQGGESRTEKPIGHWLEGGRAAGRLQSRPIRGLTCTRCSGWDLHGTIHGWAVLNGSLPSCWEPGSGLPRRPRVLSMDVGFFSWSWKPQSVRFWVDVEWFVGLDAFIAFVLFCLLGTANPIWGLRASIIIG